MSKVSKVHVEGKLYDIKDPKSVCTIVPAGYFPTLDSFVKATNSDAEARDRGYSFRFQDTGGWGPRKTKDVWYRCLIVRYQNRIGTEYNIFGTALLSEGSSLYIGYITGATSFEVAWYSVIEYGTDTMWEALPAGVALANGHFVAGNTGWTALTSHGASNDIANRWRLQLGQDGAVLKYQSTDSGKTWQHVGSFRTQQENNYFASVYYADPSPTDVTVTGVLKFNTIVNNFGGCYSTSTGIYTCPVAGLYYANFTFYSNNASASQRAQVSMGGRGYMVNGSHGHSISAMEFLPAGAQIFAGCPNSNYPFTFYSGANHNRFTVNLVKATT